jgi:hypothetical protein
MITTSVEIYSRMENLDLVPQDFHPKPFLTFVDPLIYYVGILIVLVQANFFSKVYPNPPSGQHGQKCGNGSDGGVAFAVNT